MDPVRIALTAILLIGAAVLDLRQRRVPNSYWLPFAAIAGGYVVADVLAQDWLQILGGALVAALAYAFWRLGLWGGADAKGTMVLAVLASDHYNGITTIAALDALVVGMALVLLWPIGLFAWNITHRHLRWPAMLVGTVMTIDDASTHKVWPMELPHADPSGRRLRYLPRPGDDAGEALDTLRAAGRKEVWVTPQVPLLAFIALGYGLVNVFGSPLGWLG